jgi:hypothetical protein
MTASIAHTHTAATQCPSGRGTASRPTRNTPPSLSRLSSDQVAAGAEGSGDTRRSWSRFFEEAPPDTAPIEKSPPILGMLRGLFGARPVVA